MKVIKALPLYYNLLLVVALIVQGTLAARSLSDILLLFFLLPILGYFSLSISEQWRKTQPKHHIIRLKEVLAWISLVLTSFLFVVIATNMRQLYEGILILLLFPLAGFFWIFVGKKIFAHQKAKREQEEKEKALREKVAREKAAAEAAEAARIAALLKVEVIDLDDIPSEEETALALQQQRENAGIPELERLDGDEDQIDIDFKRREFLKIIGGTSLGLLVASLMNPQKAEAAFFGSVPGPGTVALKDTNDTEIDPAIKSPTDAYGITEIDDSAIPSYYGFVNKEGAWYILREDSSNSYRYAKGNSNFSSNWTSRAGLSYDYYHNVF